MFTLCLASSAYVQHVLPASRMPASRIAAPVMDLEASFAAAMSPSASGETCHIIMDHEGKMPYWEGQSYGVVPPGENPKKPGKPNAVRLYSIASSRYGDDMTGTTTSLCVRR